MIIAPALSTLRRASRALVVAVALLSIAPVVPPSPASARSLNPSGFALADDDAIFDHVSRMGFTTVYEVAQLLD